MPTRGQMAVFPSKGWGCISPRDRCPADFQPPVWRVELGGRRRGRFATRVRLGPATANLPARAELPWAAAHETDVLTAASSMEHSASLARAGAGPPGGGGELGSLRRSEMAAATGTQAGMATDPCAGMVGARRRDLHSDLLEHPCLVRERFGGIEAAEDLSGLRRRHAVRVRPRSRSRHFSVSA